MGARRLGGQRRAGDADQGGDAGDATLFPLRPAAGAAHVLHDGRIRGRGRALRQVLLIAGGVGSGPAALLYTIHIAGRPPCARGLAV